MQHEISTFILLFLDILAANEWYRINPPESIDDWRVEPINLAPNVFSTSSCLHVTFFLFLRYLQESRIAKKINDINKLTELSMVSIWVISFFINLLAVLSQALDWYTFYFYFRFIRLYMFWTLPILVIICMYVRLFFKMEKINKKAISIISLRKDSKDSVEGNLNVLELFLQEKSQQMTRSIKRVVICLVLCFLPYIGWLNYYYLNITTRAESDGHYKVHQYEVVELFQFQ